MEGVDLHCHSQLSDGVLTVDELFQQVLASDLKVFSLTDHDELRGALKLREQAQSTDLKVILGVEVSARVGELGVHILAYNIDPTDGPFESLLRSIREAKRQQMREIVTRLKSFGVHLSWSELSAGREDGYIGRAHIAAAMVPAYVSRLSTVYKRYIGFGKPAYVSARLPQGAEVIEAIHAAGGVAVLAHPRFDDLSLSLPRLVNAGLDGVEAFRPKLSRSLYENIVTVAHNRGLLLTGGSDYHGDRGEDRIGSFMVDREELKRFFERVEVS